ncbi:hypothetical protein NI389_16905 [Pseudoalteromonas xiamenensis]|uniref:hypothetical protein n=1 Tax=Pseudoalteromonas xiamenensis TaxID=882626 RepID=UPI0027E4EB1D|nr:hypothetical protein [Pseudoalteromonas xiamenensis]WMN59819.1 hypothetical protein NI389_16905 [Pseudoalteromonas xiamenensis]
MPEQEITRFTDSLSLAIEKLYKTGGFALAFGFSGIVLILGANIFGHDHAIWIIALGAILTFICLGFFLYTTLRGNKEITKSIKDNKEAVDAVQDISLQLTKLTNTAQAYSFKNIEKINKTLEIAIPQLKPVPFLGDKIEEYGLNKVGSISKLIVENSEKVENIVSDIEQALINADHRKLKTYSKDLADLVSSMKQQLKQ